MACVNAMVCPACQGPMDRDPMYEAPGRLGVCRWCGAVLVSTGEDMALRLLSDAEAMALPPARWAAARQLQQAVRTYGAARRN